MVLAVIADVPPTAGYRYALIAALGIRMGIQNAAARALAVPDLTTTVLTLTITGIAADSKLAGGRGPRPGAVLIRHAQAYDALAIAWPRSAWAPR